jgi:hypothetical protein
VRRVYARRQSSFGKVDRGPAAARGVLASSGSPLSGETLAYLQPRFGHDFGQVRVHADARAAAAAEAVSAKAFTVGQHLVFGAGEYRPGTPDGDHLLAHELAHVVQQSAGPVGGVPADDSLRVSQPGEPLERAADWVANAVMVGASPDLVQATGASASSSAGLALQREEAGKKEASPWWSDMLDGGLDIAEAIPGVGSAVKAVSGVGHAGIDLYKGDYLGAGLDLAGTIPGISEVVGYAKAAKEAKEGLEAAGTPSGDPVDAMIHFGSAANGVIPEQAEEAKAVVGAGVGGMKWGRGLDKASNALGQWITGDTKGDYSISAGLASVMTSADQAISSQFADPSQPAYTQTLGWKLANWLTPTSGG